MDEGFTVDGIHLEYEIMCFVYDKPARSFYKCVKGHTGYYACERCIVKGVRINKRMTFPTLFEPKRSHESFISFENLAHHTGISPLIKLKGLDMVKKFVIDIMHLGHLGIQKKKLNMWNTDSKTKLESICIILMSLRLKNLSNQVTCEFQRTTKSMDHIPDWKATELRFFSMYSGPFVLKGILPEHLYKCELLYFVAFRILHCDKLCLKYINNAEEYLIKYIQLSSMFYGPETLIFNFHSLRHVIEDVKFFKTSLSRINCFCFENLLGQIRRKLRAGNSPLSQFRNRFAEIESIPIKKPTLPPLIEVLSHKKIKQDEKIINIIKKLRYQNYTFSIKKPNNVVLLKNKNVVQIEKMYSFANSFRHDTIFLIGEILNKSVTEAFDYPTKASDLDIFKIDKGLEKKSSGKISLSDVESKMILLEIFDNNPDDKDIYALPLLHE